jgi:hypothetical protein
VKDRDPDLCPAQWETGRWPFWTYCAKPADKVHDHVNAEGIGPLNGNFSIPRRDMGRRIFENGEERLPLEPRIGADGGLVLVCKLPHQCGLRFPIATAPGGATFVRLKQALDHVEAI